MPGCKFKSRSSSHYQLQKPCNASDGSLPTNTAYMVQCTMHKGRRDNITHGKCGLDFCVDGCLLGTHNLQGDAACGVGCSIKLATPKRALSLGRRQYPSILCLVGRGWHILNLATSTDVHRTPAGLVRGQARCTSILPKVCEKGFATMGPRACNGSAPAHHHREHRGGSLREPGR